MAGTTASGWAGSGTTADLYRLVFDGANDFVALPAIAACSLTAFTYEVWALMPAAPSFTVIIAEGNSATTDSLAEMYTKSDGSLGFYTDNDSDSGGSEMASATSVCDGRWHHLIVEYDGTSRVRYEDGVHYGTNQVFAKGTITVNQAAVGSQRCQTTPAYFFPGAIAVARIYPFALSAAQVAQNYAAGPNASAGVWGDGVTPGAVLELVAAYGNAFVGG
jgi:hypothetical protein